MSLEPEFVKELMGKSRYQALIGALGGLELMLDAAEELIKKYDPPDQVSWQVPPADVVKRDLKKACTSARGLHSQIRQFEADLLAKEWKA